jgi:hypothetical protein
VVCEKTFIASKGLRTAATREALAPVEPRPALLRESLLIRVAVEGGRKPGLRATECSNTRPRDITPEETFTAKNSRINLNVFEREGADSSQDGVLTQTGLLSKREARDGGALSFHGGTGKACRGRAGPARGRGMRSKLHKAFSGFGRILRKLCVATRKAA